MNKLELFEHINQLLSKGTTPDLLFSKITRTHKTKPLNCPMSEMIIGAHIILRMYEFSHYKEDSQTQFGYVCDCKKVMSQNESIFMLGQEYTERKIKPIPNRGKFNNFINDMELDINERVSWAVWFIRTEAQARKWSLTLDKGGIDNFIYDILLSNNVQLV